MKTGTFVCTLARIAPARATPCRQRACALRLLVSPPSAALGARVCGRFSPAAAACVFSLANRCSARSRPCALRRPPPPCTSRRSSLTASRATPRARWSAALMPRSTPSPVRDETARERESGPARKRLTRRRPPTHSPRRLPRRRAARAGLNGSGKSNVLDAICFVLGITNLSQVRRSSARRRAAALRRAGVKTPFLSLALARSTRLCRCARRRCRTSCTRPARAA